jgi:hypothetical protein
MPMIRLEQDNPDTLRRYQEVLDRQLKDRTPLREWQEHMLGGWIHALRAELLISMDKEEELNEQLRALGEPRKGRRQTS